MIKDNKENLIVGFILLLMAMICISIVLFIGTLFDIWRHNLGIAEASGAEMSAHIESNPCNEAMLQAKIICEEYK